MHDRPGWGITGSFQLDAGKSCFLPQRETEAQREAPDLPETTGGQQLKLAAPSSLEATPTPPGGGLVAALRQGLGGWRWPDGVSGGGEARPPTEKGPRLNRPLPGCCPQAPLGLATRPRRTRGQGGQLLVKTDGTAAGFGKLEPAAGLSSFGSWVGFFHPTSDSVPPGVGASASPPGLISGSVM